MKQRRSKTFRGYNEFGFFNEFLETGQALAQRSGLPFAHGDLGGRRVVHEKKKAALEVRLDLFDSRHIDQHLAARAEELIRRQGGFKFGKLEVHPEGVFRCPCMHDAILHLEPEDLFRRHKQGASVFPADDFAERLRRLACRAQNALALFFFFSGKRAKLARACYRNRQPLRFDGFEKIGKRVGLEGREGVLVVPVVKMTSGISMADGTDRSTSKPVSPGISTS